MPLNSKGTRGWRPAPTGLSLVSADEIWLLVPGMQMSRGPKRNTKSVSLRTGGQENRGRGRARQAAKDKQKRWRSKRETEAKGKVLGTHPTTEGSKSLGAGG